MPSDFTAFGDELKAALGNPRDIEGSDFAEEIVSAYETAIAAGGDSVSGNAVSSYNREALVNAFAAMFEACLSGNVPMDLNLISPGLITFWTGATLTTTGLVPGTTSTVSAVVNAPGVPVPLPPPPPSDSPQPFVDMLTTYFQTHLTTVGGIITGMVPGSPPVATPFPFVGYL